MCPLERIQKEQSRLIERFLGLLTDEMVSLFLQAVGYNPDAGC